MYPINDGLGFSGVVVGMLITLLQIHLIEELLVSAASKRVSAATCAASGRPLEKLWPVRDANVMVHSGQDFSTVVAGGAMNGCVICAAALIDTLASPTRRKRHLLPVLLCKHIMKGERCQEMIWTSALIISVRTFQKGQIQRVESVMFAGKS